MRWIYLDPTNREEAAHRAEALARMDDWWASFQQQADRIREMLLGRTMWDMTGWMRRHLHQVDSHLAYEFFHDGATHHLAITTQSYSWLRPQIDTLLSRAPQVEGWRFHAHRLPKPPSQAARLVKQQTNADLNRLQVEVRPAPGRKINLVFFSPECRSPADEHARSSALLAAEHLLGEEDLDRWIGELAVAPTPKWKPPAWLPLGRRSPELVSPDQLPRKIASLISDYRQTLPQEPSYRFIRQAKWTAFRRKPKRQHEYPRQDDLITASCGRPDIFVAAAAQGLFFSECHTRHHEQFCYLKLDTGDQSDDARMAQRRTLEESINDALGGQQLGCVIGGGLGLRYTYIMLSLMNVRRGWSAVQQAVSTASNLPHHRAWLLFFDHYLAHEWIGLTHQTPRPPGN